MRGVKVHRLMEQAGVADVSAVAKFGDTVNDVKEGRNAGCGLVVGVLSVRFFPLFFSSSA